MFGSKRLLIAFVFGMFGLIVTTSALESKHDWLELVFITVGLGMVWVSALFGPLFVMQEKVITRLGGEPVQQGAGEEST
ncbi:MAG: hypothetical protein L0Z62_43540 [Gemmataceae bacterium]|nr:hypothetical protein [Gemmataceae bacterium]